MHIAHHYALSCGAQLAAPYIPTSFYPVPFPRYICISSQGEVSSKKYDYFQEVIDLIVPYLSPEEIRMVHLSDPQDPRLNKTINFGQLTRKHNNYITANSELLVCNDSYCSHAASTAGTKVVSLFGPLYKDISHPLWGKKENSRFLESHRNGQKPSFVGEESGQKSINLIAPEEVGASTLDLLGLEHNLSQIKTLNVGEYYQTPVIEVIPNNEPQDKLYEGGAINLRLDLSFSPDLIAKWAFNRKLNIITNKIIDRKYLDLVRPHVAQVMVEVSQDIDPDYVSSLIAGGYNTYLFSKDKESIQDLRFQFIDWDIHLNPPPEKKELDNADKICDNTYFKSSKTVSDNNKQYPSIAHWREGIESSDDQKIIDSPVFWEDLNHFRIYNN